MTILVGDIGGTNARFALLSIRQGRFELVVEERLPSRRFTSLEDAIEAFLESHPEARRCQRACFGIAGPIRGGSCEATNLPWVVNGAGLARTLGLDEVPLLNDLEAAALGLARLSPNGTRTLREGRSDGSGNRALLAPGTGFGEAVLAWDGTQHHALATEGGHKDFAPGDEEQVELWRCLQRQHGHVSWERVVSGPGLLAIFRFLLQQRGRTEPDWLVSELRDGDPSAAISRRANDERCGACREALDLWFALLGAEAGNLALGSLATGGVYLAGGIVPQLIDELLRSPFLAAFTNKGRFRPLLESIPVRVVVDDRLALWGAASRALRGDAAAVGVPQHAASGEAG